MTVLFIKKEDYNVKYHKQFKMKIKVQINTELPLKWNDIYMQKHVIYTM